MSDNDMNELGTLKLHEVAFLLGTSEDTVIQLAIQGEVPATKIDESWIFLNEDVIAFLRTRIKKDTAERRASSINDASAASANAPRPVRRRKPIPSPEELQALATAHGIILPD